MDLTQLIITVLAVLGIALMGAMAVIPTVLEFRDGTEPKRPAVKPVPVSGQRREHDLAA